MTLDHIIKERYPTFVDALRDLDDALSMIFLFANLPSTTAVSVKRIALCQRLSLEFQHFIIVTHSLRKSFLSIKGIYYQATIQGQDIMWLVPYKFVQKMTGDIDFRVMGTFIEFYTTLLGFVNYRLYNTIGLVYPPKFDSSSDERGGELGAFRLEGKAFPAAQVQENGINGHAELAVSSAGQAEADKVALLLEETEGNFEMEPVEIDDASDAIDTFEPATSQDADILPQPQATGSEISTLFSGFTFFLSRETPRAPLEFILKAFGCKRIGWDAVLGDGAFTTDEEDPIITHQVCDRPYVDPGDMEIEEDDDQSDSETALRSRGPVRIPGRVYLQPQWIWDCINQAKLVRSDLYAPGTSLPPHLSPWAKPTAGTYDPTIPLEEQEKDGEAELHEEEEELEEDASSGAEDNIEEASNVLDKIKRMDGQEDDEVEAGEGMDVAESKSSDDDEPEAEPVEADWEGIGENVPTGLSDDDEDQDQYQRELEAEAAGRPFAADAGRNKIFEARKLKERKLREEKEELERQRIMMPNKKRKIFDKAYKLSVSKEADAEKLRKKKRKFEKETKTAKSA
jgi:pescadillo